MMESPRFGLECNNEFKWWESDIDSARGQKECSRKLDVHKSPFISNQIETRDDISVDDPTRLIQYDKTLNKGIFSRGLINYNQLRSNIQLKSNEPLINIHLQESIDKTIAQRIRNGELMFYQDFVNSEFAKDYARINKTPVPQPQIRHDTTEAKLGGFNAENNFNANDAFHSNDFNSNNIHSNNLHSKNIHSNNLQSNPFDISNFQGNALNANTFHANDFNSNDFHGNNNHYLNNNIQGSETHKPINKESYGSEISGFGGYIDPRSNELIEEITDPVQKEELLRGELPVFFNPLKVKQIHPRDKKVSDNCLANYARYVEKVTKCRLLQSEIQGLSAIDEDEGIMVENEEERKIYDVYGVSESQISRAREIMNERRQVREEEMLKSKFKIGNKLQKYEELKVIKSRYVI